MSTCKSCVTASNEGTASLPVVFSGRIRSPSTDTIGHRQCRRVTQLEPNVGVGASGNRALEGLS